MNEFLTKYEKLILFLFVSLYSIVILYILFFGIIGHCATEDNFKFPYVVPEWRNNTSAINDSLISSADSVIRTRFNLSEDDNIMFFVTDLQSNLGTYQWNTLNFIVNPSVLTQVDENFSFLDNTVTLSCSFSGTYEFKWDNSYRNIGQSYGNVSILGNSSVIEINQGVYTPRYPFYMSGDDIFYGDFLVFTNNTPFQPSIPTQGHATQPTNDPNNFINGSNGSPLTKPTFPTITNYNWTVYQNPPIDNSNLESLVESLIDNVIYGFNYISSNLKAEFSNLISNLSNLFNYLVESIESAINKIIKSIHDVMTDLYNNFVSLFEPITQQLSYISAPVDTELIQGEIESTALMSDYSEVVSIKDSFVSVFTDTSEPSTFTIPIHLENLSILNVGIQYIDLSVINPVKSALRTFIWVLVSFGLVVTIIDSIPNYINGGGDE